MTIASSKGPPTCALVLALALVLVLVACTGPNRRDDADNTPSERARVARLEQERAAADKLAPYLEAIEPATVQQAVLALARLERQDALAPLLGALAAADAKVRATAGFGLGQLDLALDAAQEAHRADRVRVESALADALAKEDDLEVRRALVRALGRVADQGGLEALIGLAGAEGPLRAEALVALGVSGARRQASRRADPALLAALAAALKAPDDDVRAGAAYALFRQKAVAPQDALTSAWGSKDAQVRIFLARAAPSQEAAAAASLVQAGLEDPDWRVRVEAVRAAAARAAAAPGGSVAGLARALDEAVAQVGALAPADHVAREACLALASSSVAPAELVPRLRAAAATLASKGAAHRAAACTCAAALDAIDPEEAALLKCGVSGTALARFNVERVARARTSGTERAAVLAQLLRSDDVKVRMAAASALSAEASEPALEVMVTALDSEADVGVLSALLEPFAESTAEPLAEPGAHAAISDAKLFAVFERLRTATTFEGAEPLVTVARIARARATPAAQAIVERLREHAEPRVADAAAGVAPYTRAPGPRASVIAAPEAGELPSSVVLHTSRGAITLVFERALAPATIANFVTLARAGAYDGAPFHRVIADFVAQGGDYARGDGSGGPGYTIACENTDAPYTRGAVGMAHAGKDTGGSQFFLTHSWQPHLDGRYTLFARVSDGLDVMDALQPDDVLVRVVVK